MENNSIKIKTPVPGPKSLELLERRKKAVSNGIGIGKVPIFAEFAKGAVITDVDGNSFIDFSGGIGCLNSGHSAPLVVEAVRKQAEKLQHSCFQVTMYEPYLELAEKLIQISPGNFTKKAALFNSGAEAVENAIKIARKYTGRQSIVCFENAFHGRTFMTLTLTSKVKPYKDGFGPFAPEVYQAVMPYTYHKPGALTDEQYVDECISEFHSFLNRTVIPSQIAAIIIEPVLGEGGFIVPPEKFIKEIDKICRNNGIVLIADEIQSGFARTGKMFASEHFGLEPDLLTMAKSMSNGFPVSAVVGKEEIMDSVHPGGLGGTFAGNPVACAAALASIETIQKEKLCERAVIIGDTLRKRFDSLSGEVSCIGEVRGLGAMIGIEIVKNGKNPDKEKAEKIVYECGQNGLLILTAGVEGNIIRTLMPLSISDEQLNEALNVLEGVMRKL